jgi:hypothetical protein
MTGVGARGIIAAALLVVLPSAAGCSEGFRAPTTLEECRDSAGAGAGEMFSVAYDEESRELGRSGVVHACLGPMPGSAIRVDPPPGVTVEPAEVAVPDGGGVVPLRVTVTGGDDTVLTLALDGPDGSGAQPVGVEVDGGEWALAQAATARK